MTTLAATTAASGAILGLQEAARTLYVGDTHMKDVGRQTFLTNTFVGKFVHSAHHPLLATLTRGLYLDELLARQCDAMKRPAEASVPVRHLSMQGMGDYTDTPSDMEAALAVKIFEKNAIPMDGCDMENHGSSNAWGVVNLLSGSYQWLKKHVLRRLGLLDHEFTRAVGGHTKVLTPKDTMEMAHRLLHQTRPNGSTPDALNIKVSKEDTLEAFPEFGRFWKQSSGDRSYWECLINYDVADLKETERGGRTPSLYLQAHEQSRHRIGDREVPVFDISLDTQDHHHLLAIIPGISEFQIRLVESFMDHQLRQNPEARFRLSAHFPLRDVASGITGLFASCRDKAALKRLLSREEIILVTGAHTHERAVHDLREVLDLERDTPLAEVTLPAIVAYSPWQDFPGAVYQTAQAIGRDTMWVEQHEGQEHLRIDYEFVGLDERDFEASSMVQASLQKLEREHGYIRYDVVRKAVRKFFGVFVKRQARRLLEFFTQPLGMAKKKKKFMEFWKEDSVIRNAVDNLTAVSVTEAFDETKRLIPFLESILHFLDLEASGEPLAVKAQIQGVLTTLSDTYRLEHQAFEQAVQRGEDPNSLRRFDDFFARTGVHQLPSILVDLPKASQARHFALLAGMRAARAEYELQGGRPTEVPNQVPTISKIISHSCHSPIEF